MPRFVILTHNHPRLHWDLLLEQGTVARTWRLEQPADTPGPVSAVPLPDHRLLYLDYEGPVSGNRGSVTRWDAGEYHILSSTPAALTIRLAGGRLRGTFCLRPTAGPDRWEFTAAETSD